MTDSDTQAHLHLETRAVHAGRADLEALGVHALPIDLSTTNPLTDIDSGGRSYGRLAAGGEIEQNASPVYQRLWNPTTARYEEALAELEGAEASVAFSSGMAAISSVILAAAGDGRRHIVVLRTIYGGTESILSAGTLATEVTFVDRVDEIPAAVTDQTGLVIAETPANPTVELTNLDTLATAAGDVPLMVDNTFATPVLQQPLRHGAQFAVHSATKYIGGHGDVLGGIVACDNDWARRIRHVRSLTGAIAHPLASYLSHRGLATLPLRVHQQQSNAQAVAEALQGMPGIERVMYPGLPDCDPEGLVGTQMAGPGAMMAIDVGTYERAEAVAAAAKIFTHAVSLGGVDSLLQHPASLTHRPAAAEAKPNTGVLRISIGLEHPDDLIADLAQAIAAA
ncbi:MAG TPA: aminotransferase class I/II-fold pyridoxal phosphate-dependent enzyme [Candidatus Agrococcus pullicola]|uniref:homocysteine desulfhydrase n=1 Tax=Candidatus Agrococcus pullicola TaxID=2838429 RepID=A0A9D1YT72_9MICO|nr:aminotransferase class I/II-fold pyridoxal phosphate-dependent enzyme [Candidatus Agrococcus pullicola]